jgi:hypothetical protein
MPEIRVIGVSGSIPTSTQLALGDIAINTYDGKLYIKKLGNTPAAIVEVVTGEGGGGSTVSASYATTASHAINAESSSFALTASYVPLAQTASYVGNAISSSQAVSSSYATIAGSVPSYETPWIAYEVLWTTDGEPQPVLNDGTVTGYYKLIGKTCFVRVKLNCGAATTFGTGAFQFSLPFSASSPDGIQFPCSLLNNGVSWYTGTVNGTYSGATNKSAILINTSPAPAVSSAAPFVWGNTDSIQFNGTYEAL